MDEREWLACTDSLTMLDFLRGKSSDRKFRLYACADCRRVWAWFAGDEASRQAVELAERYADGEASEVALMTANQSLGPGLVYRVTLPQVDGSSGAWWVAHGIVESVSQCFEGDEIAAAAGAEKVIQSRLARDIFGNPFRPVVLDPTWRTPAVLALAQAAYDNRTLPAGTLEPDRLDVLADVLEESGCANADILGHLRGPGPHVRGCFVIDTLLAKS